MSEREFKILSGKGEHKCVLQIGGDMDCKPKPTKCVRVKQGSAQAYWNSVKKSHKKVKFPIPEEQKEYTRSLYELEGKVVEMLYEERGIAFIKPLPSQREEKAKADLNFVAIEVNTEYVEEAEVECEIIE